MATNTGTQRAQSEAKAQLASIVEMVKALLAASEADDDTSMYEARRAILEDALSVEVRTDWHSPDDDHEPAEYRILLCPGGPAVRITGDLGRFAAPESAQLEHQDRFTPWEKYFDTTEEEDEALLTYARVFDFDSSDFRGQGGEATAKQFMSQAVRDAGYRFLEALGDRPWPREATVAVHEAFALYNQAWDCHAHHIGDWRWPVDEVRNGGTLKGDEPWTILLRYAAEKVRSSQQLRQKG